MSAGNGQQEDLRGQPVGELVKQLSEQTSTLVRQEMELAKTELTERGKAAGKGAGLVGGGGLLGLLAAGALTAFLILLLAEVMDAWLAALIVAVVYGAGAALLALRGRDQIREGMPPAPEQTVESVKEDVRWAKTRATSARR
jgi:Putative Actinobacterial Holin-X, holin superfamily III